MFTISPALHYDSNGDRPVKLSMSAEVEMTLKMGRLASDRFDEELSRSEEEEHKGKIRSMGSMILFDSFGMFCNPLFRNPCSESTVCKMSVTHC